MSSNTTTKTIFKHMIIFTIEVALDSAASYKYNVDVAQVRTRCNM
jgi:hypothetical protein